MTQPWNHFFMIVSQLTIVMFVDTNFFLNRKYCRNLFETMNNLLKMMRKLF